MNKEAGIDQEGMFQELILAIKALEAHALHLKHYKEQSDQLRPALLKVTEAQSSRIKGVAPEEISKAVAERRVRFLETPPWEAVAKQLYQCAKTWKKSAEATTPYAEAFAKELGSRLLQDLKDGDLPLSTLGLYKETLAEVSSLQNEIVRLTNPPPQNIAEAQALLETMFQLETVQQQLKEATGEIRRTCETLKKMEPLLTDEKLLGEVKGQLALLEGTLSSYAKLNERIEKVDRKQTLNAAANAVKDKAALDRLVQEATHDPSKALNTYLWLSQLKGNPSPFVRIHVHNALKDLERVLHHVEPTLADREELRQTLSLKRPKQERSWWGSLCHPEEWSDTVINILRVGSSAMQLLAHGQRVYQKINSVQARAAPSPPPTRRGKNAHWHRAARKKCPSTTFSTFNG